MLLNSNRSNIQRRLTKKRYKGDKTKIYRGFVKDNEDDDCGLNFTKDLKCGCTGNIDNNCLIF